MAEITPVMEAVHAIWGRSGEGCTSAEEKARFTLISDAMRMIVAGSHGLVARTGDGAFAGVAAVGSPSPYNRQVTLQYLGTKPGVPGAGATLLAAAALSHPNGPGVLRLESNSRSAAFYQRLGLTLISHNPARLWMTLSEQRTRELAARVALLPRPLLAPVAAPANSGLG